MGLPAKLKNMTVFNDGQSYLGEVTEFVLPKLTRKLEEYRGGGLDGPIKIDMGQNAIDCEWKCGGFMEGALRQYGILSATGVMLRFNGAYQRDDSGAVHAVEIVVRGRHEEIDMGTAKPGDDTETAVKTSCVDYKISLDSEVLIEIDLLNMIMIVNGVDMLAEQREALGMGLVPSSGSSASSSVNLGINLGINI